MKKVLESIMLKVELPMIVEVDNKGAVDLVCGWSNSGGTKHMDVRIMYLRGVVFKFFSCICSLQMHEISSFLYFQKNYITCIYGIECCYISRVSKFCGFQTGDRITWRPSNSIF